MSVVAGQRTISPLLDALWQFQTLRLLVSVYLSKVYNMIVPYCSISCSYGSRFTHKSGVKPVCSFPSTIPADVEVKSQTAVSVFTTSGVPDEVPDLPACDVAMFDCFCVSVCGSNARDTSTLQASL